MNNQDPTDLNEKVQELERRISHIENIILSRPPEKSGIKTLSIKEFVLTKKPKDDGQKILTIAYFLEKYEGLSSFNAKDLSDSFGKAKEKAPVNINDRVNKIIGKTGHIMEVSRKKDNLKSWQLTNSGEYFVEKSLPTSK